METIRIQPASDLLIPGESTRVPITIVVDSPIRVRGVHATFHGAEETKANYTTYNAATKSVQTHTAVEHVDIVKSEYPLAGRERKGLLDNLTDGVATLFGRGEHDVWEPGEYTFEVEVQLPPDARPTFEGEKCRVFYELSVLIDVPLGRDYKAVQSFRVVDDSEPELPPPAPVRTRYPEDQEGGQLSSWFAPDIRVEAALGQNAFHKGDWIEGIFVLQTPQPLKYHAIHVRLISVETTEAAGHKDEHIHPGEPVQIASAGVIESRFSQEFRLPAKCPGPAATRGRLFSIERFVQIELDVPWAKDPKVRVPVTVAG